MSTDQRCTDLDLAEAVSHGPVVTSGVFLRRPGGGMTSAGGDPMTARTTARRLLLAALATLQRERVAGR